MRLGCSNPSVSVNRNIPVQDKMNDGHTNDLFQAARGLLSGSFQGVLSSHSLDCPGYPFGSALPFSIAADGWPLLLISHLAKHTRNLLANPQCSLTLSEAGTGDLQQRMRLTMLARALPVDTPDDALAERHFRYYPNSRDYFEQLNFGFFRLLPERFYLVGGFGAARWMGVDRLSAKNPFSQADEAAMLGRLAVSFGTRLQQHLSASHALLPVAEAALIPIALDGTGLDLRQADRLFRIGFPQQISTLDQATRLLDSLI